MQVVHDTALSPVPRDGAGSKVRSFIEWKHATGVRFRCHVLRGCHARGAVGEVERPSSRASQPRASQPRASHLLPPPPTKSTATIHPLNIAGELINRTLPRLGQGYLDALVRSCVKEAGTGCVSKTSKVAGGWSESGNEKQESWRRREPLGGGHGQDRSPKTTAPPDLVVKFVSQE